MLLYYCTICILHTVFILSCTLYIYTICSIVRHEAVAVMILSEAAEGGRRWAQTGIAKKLPRRALVVDLIAQEMQRARVKQAFDE